MEEDDEGLTFEPKEDINFFLHFDVEEYKNDNDNTGLYFEITDKDGNLKHDGFDFSKLSDESLMLIANSLQIVLEDILEPEIEKRNEKYFNKLVNEEIIDLIKSSNMKEGLDAK